MIVKATIRLRNLYTSLWGIWSIEREHSYGNSEHTAISHLLICPACQRIWAKHIIENDTLLWPVAQFCDQCPIIPSILQPVPGSLLVEEGLGLIDESLLNALPLELL